MTYDEKLGIVLMYLGMFILVLCGVLLIGM